MKVAYLRLKSILVYTIFFDKYICQSLPGFKSFNKKSILKYFLFDIFIL